VRKILFILLCLIIIVKNIFAYENYLWVTRLSLTNKERVDDLCQFLNKGNIDNVFLQLVGRGEAFYKSDILDISEEIDYREENFAPFEYFLSKLNPGKVKIHIWINALYVWSKRTQPQNPGHIFYNKDSFVMNKYGENILDYNIDKLKTMGIDGYFLDPSEPQTQDYIKSVVNEILKKYGEKIDGIHLDFIRYPSPEFRYNYYSVRNFIEKYDFNPLKLKDNDTAKLSMWDKWCESKVTDIVEDTKKILTNHKEKKIILSVAVKPDYREARVRYSQNWVEWIDKKLVDYCIIMSYANSFQTYTDYLNQSGLSFRKKFIIPGIGIYLKGKTIDLKESYYTKYEKFPGNAYFSYDYLAEHNLLDDFIKNLPKYKEQ